ncbi:citrate lyase (plasmid) [Azospirillum argentinense]|uniref:Citrate lyase n=1 Tax=Azospirillum argentinense TaxID=2970906 RepID=A0A060DTJ5_9PROT|nr:CoA ester lyase [Azospirillum argentinense]AIB15995.1 citrate lyase [Azospirillum argentinense]EZQ03468.1 citrate lyase [Azospirillum argentinense]
MTDLRSVRRRSFLFVPGLRPDRFAKALETGADVVCIDLEDAVAPDRKDEARALSLPTYHEQRAARAEKALRINSIRSPEGIADIDAILKLETLPDALVLPKVRSADEVRIVADLLRSRPEPVALYVIIETAEGLERVAEIAGADPSIVALFIGAVDLSAELRVRPTWDALLYARSRIVHATARAGVAVLDVPFLDLEDAAGLETEARRAAALGFTGKALIHPGHLAAIHAAFTPTAEEVAHARRIIAAFQESTTGLVVVDGKLIEKPVVREMERILLNAGTAA